MVDEVDDVADPPLGVNTTVNAAAESALVGVQAQDALELITLPAEHPLIETPPTRKSAVPEVAPLVVATIFCEEP